MGIVLGFIIGIVGGVGFFFGGCLVDCFGVNNVCWYMMIFVWGFLIVVLFSLVVFGLNNIWLVLVFYVVFVFVVNFYIGLMFGMM